MFEGLRTLIATKPAGPDPEPADGKITLREVLRRNWEELWYQPKIDLRSKRLVGAEGLVRARRPDGSIIPPAEFLPGAKEDEMLVLTERVILAALRDFEDCAALGASVKLSVNVPVSALVKLPIAQILREERPSAPTWPGLILEVTEDEALNDLKIANDVADELRELDCTLSLDDFGAGYSSLARLRQLPFGELKIDRSYVIELPRRPRQCRAVRDHHRAGQAFRAQDRGRGHRDHATRATKCRTSAAISGRAICSPDRCRRPTFLGALGRHMIGGPRPAGATALGAGQIAARPVRRDMILRSRFVRHGRACPGHPRLLFSHRT